MADNSVFITGAAPGALSEALNDMPAWATERTLTDIERVLQQSFNISKQLLTKLGKSGTAGMDPAAANELNNIIEELTKNSKKRNSEDENNQKDKKSWWDKRNKQNRQVISGIEKYLPTVALLYTANSRIVRAMEDNVTTFAQLQQSGINVVAGFNSATSGFTALQQMTAVTGVRFTELSSIMSKYSTTVNAFTAGKFANTIKDAGKGLQQFGFTTKESAELLGSYLESQSGFTNATNQSSEEASQKLQKFGQGLSRVSMVTGMAKNAILANMEAISKSNEASILSANIGEHAASSTLTFISSMKDQNLGRAFLKMMTDQIKPLNSTFMSFQKIGLGGFGQKLINFTQSLKTMSPEDAAQATKAFEAQNRAEIEHAKKQSNFYSQIPELAGDAQANLTLLVALQQQARTTKEMTVKDMKKMEASNAARSKLSSQWETLMSKFQMAFGAPISLLNALGTGLEYLNKGIDRVVNGLNYFGDETSSWVGVISIAVAAFKIFGGVIAGPFRLIGSTLSWVAKSLLSTGTGIAGFSKYIGSVSGMVGNTFKAVLGAITSPFKLIGSLSSMIGTALQTLLGSVVSGFKYIGSFSGMIGNTFKALLEPIVSGFKYIGSFMGSIGGVVLKLAGVVGMLYTAFEVGHAIGTFIYDLVKDFEFFTNMMDAIFHGLDKVIQYIPGSVGSDARDRIATSEKVAKLPEITVPKNPTPSTVDSPSAVPAKSVANSNLPNTTNAQLPATAPKSNNPSSSPDISSTLTAQTNLLQQILLALENNVSVSKDILKYSRISA